MSTRSVETSPAPEPAYVELTVGGAEPGALSLATVACLLFGSGLCALVYQVAWLREMRLVFGASTAASAAVLAIFMGGLGLGGLLLGPRADRAANPLAFYATLELAIAAVAATTPGLVWIARASYVAVGGATTLGLAGATLARLVLTALVLCVPTVLMGGTLPAAARAVETEGDAGRRRLAALYGVNTLGAVTGSLLATFLLLEAFGTRTTLWVACLVNLLVGVLARKLARERAVPERAPTVTAHATAGAPPSLVLGAAFVVGFAFFLMELVWYRMLAPLLGGSSFTFGLILSVALFGVGLGGTVYARRPDARPPTRAGFALTCALEALLLAVPFALGDRIAFLALLLRPLATTGFLGLALGWSLVTAVVVLPASIVAGVQFPMLIALLGRGGTSVGRHVGLAYAWNTVGAIAGALAGGFGALPLLSATGTWGLVVVLLGALALAANGRARTAAPAIAAAAVALLFTTGPTAAWRHSPIGAGRAELKSDTRRDLLDWANQQRRTTGWAVDGVESSVALSTANAYAFVVNGKSDGNARGDAGTQVMFPLVAAILHGAPKRSLVIGLGTGSSAGWLAAVPSMEHVDVVELEPAIVEIARLSTPVNHDVLANPKIHLITGDAREVLLTTRERYDLVVSEPSNPYRAGIASLFTQEFYEAVAERLAPGGLFAQWLQAYEVDSRTIRTVYATLTSVFPELETWQTQHTDLLLVASERPIAHDVAALGARVREEPYRTALSVAWRADDLPGFFAHFIATPAFARAVAAIEPVELNTDDRTPIEFGFARSAGHQNLFDVNELRALARARGESRPALTGGSVDWAVVDDRHAAQLAGLNVAPPAAPGASRDQQLRAAALRAWVAGKLDETRAAWSQQPREPESSIELVAVGEALADAGDERALAAIERLRTIEPVEADVLLARLRWRQRRLPEAAGALTAALERYRHDPWPVLRLMQRAVQLTADVAQDFPVAAPRFFDALGEPFAVHAVDQVRLGGRVHLLGFLDFARTCRDAIAPFEPWVPWERNFLGVRVRCYAETNDARLATAEADLDAFLRDEAERLGDELEPPPAS